MTATPQPATNPPAAREALGRVITVSGAQAAVGLSAAVGTIVDARLATVGKFLGIVSGAAVIIGMIVEISEQPATGGGQQYRAVAKLDLVGEIRADATGRPKFQRGVTDYPSIGDPALLTGPRELAIIYGAAGADCAVVGTLVQDQSMGAYVNTDDLLSKHFAILGTTGTGKSSGVAVVLRQILQSRPNLRIFLVDPHNEYGRCFGDKAQVLTPRNLRLPFWLFNFEEIVDAIFAGRPGIDEEVEILSECIPLAKGAYLQYRGADRALAKKRDAGNAGYTADTPVPYRLEDLINQIDERMGKLENRSSRMIYHKLIQRIQVLRSDPRYAFMFENANIGGDTMVEVLSQLFRLPPNGKPMTIMQLAGFPAEVVDSVVSVLCRMAFDFGLWSDGIAPLLFVCEEAHRYAPANAKIGFGPTRRALSRIAKEGRKYGVYLGLVTQRPAEIDPNIISQCSTLFAMRMSNDRDQALIRSAVSDAAANLLSFIPSLGTREVFAFGSGVAVPTRLKFTELPAEARPNSEAAGDPGSSVGGMVDTDLLNSVVDRWRHATLSNKGNVVFEDENGGFNGASDPAPLQPAQPTAPPVPQRPSILRRPLDAGPDLGPAVTAAPPRRY